jgi:hypothetical protein
MRRVLAFLTVWCLAGPAVADPAVVHLQPTPDGIRVDYRLAAPTSRFVFDTPLSAGARVTAIGEEVAVAPDAVSSDRPLSGFSLLFGPDRVRVDATYPVVSRLGEGWMVHVPSLLGEAGAGPADVTIDPGPGWDLTAGPGTQPTDGFVYIGPEGLASSDGPRAVVDGAVPGWLADDARAALETSNAFFAEGLVIPAPGRPVLLIGLLPAEDRSTYIGDVTPNGVINLQFAAGMLPPDRDSRFTDMVAPFVAHETFHVWQGDRYRDAEGVNGRWLTEGSAEYFSLLAQAARSPGAAARSRQMLARRLAGCLSAMDERPQGLLRLAGRDAETTRYDCGTVSQWLADLQLRSDGGLFAAWRRLLTLPDGYGVADFRALLAGHPSAGQAALLDGADDIPAAVLAALGALGAGVGLADPEPAAWAQAALWPLLQSSCSGQMGVQMNDGRFFLDTGDRCGPLSGDLEAVSIAGHRFDASAEAAFRRVEAACTARGVVSVGLMDGETPREVSAPCRRASPPPPPAYEITRIS